MQPESRAEQRALRQTECYFDNLLLNTPFYWKYRGWTQSNHPAAEKHEAAFQQFLVQHLRDQNTLESVQNKETGSIRKRVASILQPVMQYAMDCRVALQASGLLSGTRMPINNIDNINIEKLFNTFLVQNGMEDQQRTEIPDWMAHKDAIVLLDDFGYGGIPAMVKLLKPIEYGGTIKIRYDSNEMYSVECVVTQCEERDGGWYRISCLLEETTTRHYDFKRVSPQLAAKFPGNT